MMTDNENLYKNKFAKTMLPTLRSKIFHMTVIKKIKKELTTYYNLCKNNKTNNV